MGLLREVFVVTEEFCTLTGGVRPAAHVLKSSPCPHVSFLVSHRPALKMCPESPMKGTRSFSVLVFQLPVNLKLFQKIKCFGFKKQSS